MHPAEPLTKNAFGIWKLRHKGSPWVWIGQSRGFIPLWRELFSVAWGLQQSREKRIWVLQQIKFFSLKRKQIGASAKGFPRQFSPGDLGWVNGLRHSQLSKPRSPWGKTLWDKSLWIRIRKSSSPVVYLRRPSFSECNKGSTQKTKHLLGVRVTKTFLKHSLNLKDGNRVPNKQIFK